MSRLRLYGDTSGYLDIKVPDAANSGTYDIVSGVFSNVTASGTIQDSKGDVRKAIRNLVSSTPYTVPSGSSGEFFEFISGSNTINVNAANFSEGDVVTLYNHQNTTKTITFDTWPNSVRIAGDTTNYSGNSITLATYGIATILCTRSNRIVINGNVS